MESKYNYGIKVLIVEDDKLVQLSLSAILQKLGVRNIVVAGDGSHGLAQLDLPVNLEINLIICDLNMPLMDGIEFLRHVAKRNFMGSIIILSGSEKGVVDMVGELALAHDLDILGTVRKPIKEEQLSQLLKAFSVKSEFPQTKPVEMVVTKKELQAALNNQALELFYQPKICLKTSKVLGVEALIRWEHNKKGMISPTLFVELAEKEGLIEELTNYVIKTAIKQKATWENCDLKLDLELSINLSVANLAQLDLPDYLINICKSFKVDTNSIILEITETQLLKDIAKPFEILSRLKLAGFRLSIDDFGTGYSTFEQLKRIPFSEIKIDRLFVHGAFKKNNQRSIVESSIQLGKSLNLSIVVEGVEDKEDWDFIKSLDCDIAQGYYIAKPMPGSEIAHWIKSYNK